MNKINIIYIALFLFIQEAMVFSQEQVETEKISRFSSRLDISSMLGGQLYNDHFVYDPGFAIQFTQNYKISENFEAGLGSGYISLMNENFIPVYVEALGYKKKKKNSPVIRFQLGGVFAWINTESYPPDYSMEGGIYFSAGMGRKIPLKKRYSILFHWSICHISAKFNYEIFGNNAYTSPANYDMLQLSFGVIRD